MSSRRDEALQAVTAGVGLLAQGFVTLGGLLRRTAQAFEDLAKLLEMEQDLDVMMEDDERFPDSDPEVADEEEYDEYYVPPATPPVNP